MRYIKLHAVSILLVLLAACSSDDGNVSSEIDTDNDGVADLIDNCPSNYNPLQTAVIGDATELGDICDDEELDAIADADDNCPLVSNNDQIDSDGNGVGDACESCDASSDPDCSIAIVLSDPEYFKEVAMKFEFETEPGTIRKWRSNIEYIVLGDPQAELEAELDRVVAELNSLIDLQLVEVADESQANFKILLGSGADYAALQPGAEDYIEANYGMFWVYWNANKEIYTASMYVDIFRTDSLVHQKHLLREELTQALGLGNDSRKYIDSSFYSGYSLTTEYTEIDRELIRTLYNPAITVGMSEVEVNRVLGIE